MIALKICFILKKKNVGLPSIENHAIPGRYEIIIPANEQKDITFVASLEENIEEIDARDVINKEIVRLTELTYDSGLENKINDSIIPKRLKKGEKLDAKKLVRDYIIAADNFVVYRPSFGLHTIIAGYPWFLDWGRDSLISFEGLLLKTKRYEIAREILLTMIKDVKYGLVPNGYSGYDNRPLYNSADASLLLFEQVKKYLNYTEDYEFVKQEIYQTLVKIIEAYSGKIDIDDNNIYLDEDGLISSGTEFIQNTWMDAKIGNLVVTPRNGKAVEINSMWYNALKIMEELSAKYETKQSSTKYKKMADKTKKSFNEKFYNKRRKCLYDVLGDNKMRPNQLFALSLSFPVIDPKSDIAEEIIDTVDKKLLNEYGLKTLAKGEPNYIEKYEGDAFKRDMSYHQGITWPWLLGLYYDSLKNMLEVQKTKTKKEDLQMRLNNFVENVRNVFIPEFEEGKTVGGLPEIYDSIRPYEAKGAFEQAWSISEIFRIIFN